MRRVIVNVDNLILKGFRYEDRHAVADGLRAELLQLLESPVFAQRLVTEGNLAGLRINTVSLQPNTPPLRVGAETARAIARGVEK